MWEALAEEREEGLETWGLECRDILYPLLGVGSPSNRVTGKHQVRKRGGSDPSCWPQGQRCSCWLPAQTARTACPQLS